MDSEGDWVEGLWPVAALASDENRVERKATEPQRNIKIKKKKNLQQVVALALFYWTRKKYLGDWHGKFAVIIAVDILPQFLLALVSRNNPVPLVVGRKLFL